MGEYIDAWMDGYLDGRIYESMDMLMD